MIHYIGKVLTPMSILEIILYSIVGAIIIVVLFKWLIYDKFIKKDKNKKPKRNKESIEEDEWQD